MSEPQTPAPSAAVSVDNLLPKEITIKAENIGVIKANLDLFTLLALSILAGAFISLGSVFFTVVTTGNGVGGAIKLPLGIMRLVGGFSFCLGLILVVIAGSELFTGNILITMAAASKKISVKLVARNWVVVYIGNLIGAVTTAYMIFASGQYKLSDGIFGVQALAIAAAKCGLPFMEALIRGIYCNALVCLAIWLCFSGRTVVDKIVSILFPITAFVTVGFEHCVANMYLIPAGIFIKNGAEPAFWSKAGSAAETYAALTWKNFFIENLLPVSIGNVIGGLMVGLVYWVIYNRPNILNADNQLEMLKRHIGLGKRRYQRYDANGRVTLVSAVGKVTGNLNSISEGGIMCTVGQDADLVAKSEKITCDIEYSAVESTKNADIIKVPAVNGVVVSVDLETTGQACMMIDFIDLTEGNRSDIQRLVGSSAVRKNG
ncbi:MAG: formate/nitrite family transporter [Candidatus Magnetominusculus sp. LBB02]|nr:formate/nitrite family transporter [Candidatus Magnetominusculus sp. LBB02]